jgi:PST family polysaccharide transporter
VLKATGQAGSSALVKLVAGVVSAKVVALLLGPTGISDYTQFQYVLTIAALIGACGINTSIVREVGRAEAADDRAELRRIYATGLLTTWLISTLTALAVWLLRGPIAAYALGDARLAPYLAWIALAIPLSSVTTIQVALLNGLRLIGTMARVVILGALAGLLATVGLVWAIGQPGLLIGLAAGPAVSALVGQYYVRAAMAERDALAPLRALLGQIDPGIVRNLAALGSTVMVTALLAQGTQFGARIWLLDRLGARANGEFQAAWMISIGYMSLVLYAMAADYYPRLVAAQGRPDELGLTINQQLKIALLLIAPVAVALMAFAPVAAQLLYSAEFTQTATILRWQLMGDILKAVSWAFGFVLLAAGRSAAYFLVELLWNVLFLAGIVYLTPRYGIAATGVSFLGSYIVYAAITWHLATRTAQYRVSRDVLQILLVVGALMAAIWLVEWLTGAFVEYALLALITAAAAAYSLVILEQQIGLLAALRARLRPERPATALPKDSA